MRRNGRSQIALLALMAVVYSPERATFGRRLSVPIKTAVSCRTTVLADSEQALPKWGSATSDPELPVLCHYFSETPAAWVLLMSAGRCLLPRLGLPEATEVLHA
jgi:hypothetical protein